MSTVSLLYQAALAVGLVLCSGLAAYAWRNRERRGATYLVGVLVGAVWWTTCSLVSVQFRGTMVAQIAGRALFVGVALGVAFFILQALAYTHRDHLLNRRTYALLAVEPILINVAVWTPGLQDAVLAYGGPDPGSFYGVTVTPGPLFLVHTVYSYALLAAGAVMFVQFAVRTESLYRRQVLAMLAALAAPWVGNALFVGGVVDFDLTPVGYTVTGVALWWAVFRQEFLDLVPVARDTVFDHIGAAVFVLDRNGRVVDLNPAARRFLSVEDDPIGREATDLVADRPAALEALETLAAADGDEELTVNVGGEHYRVQMSLLTDEAGETLGRLFLVNDVTEREHRQAELKRQNERLEQFASVVSHDLRNPLNVATGQLELARMRGDEEYFDGIEQAHQRMDAIIDDVLTLAREGQHVQTRETVALSTLARRAWGAVTTEDATLDIGADRDLEGDPDRLQRAFENLFRNAVEHGSTGSQNATRSDDTVEHGTDDGDVSGLTVTVGATPGGFYVADDGRGLPEEDVDVFENGYTTEADGTGFGLGIVQSIVEAHGWTITAGESESGGARFDVGGVGTRPGDADGVSTLELESGTDD
jgi:PAS domain S-box-containing protein